MVPGPVRCLAVLALTLAPARADVIVEGHHNVPHETVVRGAGDHPGWTFWYGPSDHSGGATRLEGEATLAFHRWSSPRIYALKEGEAPPPDVDRAWLEDPVRVRQWMTTLKDLPLFSTKLLQANREYYVRVNATARPSYGSMLWPFGSGTSAQTKFVFLR